MRPRLPRSLTVLAAAAAVTTSLAAAPVAAAFDDPTSTDTAEPTQVDAPVPELAWGACEEGSPPDNARCAKADVPLDYDEPDGETITLSLIKIPAADQEHRIGSLFTNPGGPGGPAVQAAPMFAQSLGAEIPKRFDVIGIDPRGVGGSEKLNCTKPDGVEEVPAPNLRFPRGDEQIAANQAYDEYLAKSCEATAGPILDNMSTADTARDMDLIRQAVGDEQLSYYGVSYGTYLGAVYANMFPDRVRAVVTDSAVDPVAWQGNAGNGETEPITTRWGAAEGLQDTFDYVMAKCDEASILACPLTGNAKARFERVRKSLAERPLQLPGYTITEQHLILADHQALYNKSYYTILTGVVKAIDVLRFPLQPPAAQSRTANATPQRVREVRQDARRDAVRLLDRMKRKLHSPDAGIPIVDQIMSLLDQVKRQPATAFEGVACVDGQNPSDPDAWTKVAAEKDEVAPMGVLWAWNSSACAQWPGSSEDSYQGSFDNETSTPLLVLNNTHDPATPLNGAQALHEVSPGSRLVTINGPGHGVLNSSACALDASTAYLIDQELPAEDLTCDADAGPFGLAP